ncbi:MAG: FtsQ-type POTRA domain-containing protein [Chloroflexota bacterium]|nr:FtsQ-type POTRA domain-containing protein [Chloroflexota bacterium]
MKTTGERSQKNSRRRKAGTKPGMRRYRAASSQPLSLRGRERLRRSNVTALRAVAGLLLLGMVTLLVFLFADNSFFVQAREIQGIRFTNEQAIYEQTEILNYNVFWIDAREVEERIEGLPHVKHATVKPQLPNKVLIDVLEREPEVLWHVYGQNAWVDGEGVMMPAISQLPTLPVVQDRDGSSIGRTGRIDPQLVAGIRELTQLLPGIVEFAYDERHGLHFQANNGTIVYLGRPSGLPSRVKELAAIQDTLLSQGLRASEIDLRYDGGHFYKLGQSTYSQ